MELLKSPEAIRLDIKEQFNPNQEIIDNLKALCEDILEPLREKINEPILITSGYRCESLNNKVGGADTSQHMQGQAADIHINGLSIEDLFQYIKKSDLNFDQLIQEFNNWVHISFNKNKKKQRNQVLRAIKQTGKTVYIPVLL